VNEERDAEQRGPSPAPESVEAPPELEPPRAEREVVASGGVPDPEGELHDPAPVITSRRVGVWLAVVSFLCFSYFLPHWDWNQNSRLDMTVAAVDHGTFAIDQYQGNTGDKDFFRGHYYSSKAPGQSLMAIPVYLGYETFMNAIGEPPMDPPDDMAVKAVVIVATTTIPATLLLLLFFWFLGYLSSSVANRALVTLALGLGTNIFSYSQQLFGHVPAAASLFAGFVLIYILAHPDRPRNAWTDRLMANPELTAMLAGLALGMAILIEFPTAIIAFLIGLYALRRLPFRVVPYVAVGAAPPLMMLLAYDYAVYGNPLTLGYASGASVSYSSQAQQGFAGIVWPPKWDAIDGMSFDPYRGLFFLSPFLLLAFPGLRFWRERGDRQWPLFLAIPVVFFFLMTMFVSWWGGLTVGPRYLIPMIPFLAVPCIFALDRVSTLAGRDVVRNLVYVLIGISIANTWIQTIAGTSILFPPENNHDPLFTASLPALARGEIYLNHGMDLGLTGPGSLIPLFLLLVLWSAAVFVPASGLTRGWTWLAAIPRTKDEGALSDTPGRLLPQPRINVAFWLTVILLGGFLLRLIIAPIGGFQMDLDAIRVYSRRLAAEPLSHFYAANNLVTDHLPGDLWVIWATTKLYRLISSDAALGAAQFTFVLKLVPAFADLGIGTMLYLIGRKWGGAIVGLLAAALFMFNPASIFLTAVWGQWDSVSAFFALTAIWLFVRGSPQWSLPVLTYAMLVKPPFAALAPLFTLAFVLEFILPHLRPADGVDPAQAHQALLHWVRRGAVGVMASLAVFCGVLLPFNVGVPPFPTQWNLFDRLQYAWSFFPWASVNGFDLWSTPIAGNFKLDNQPFLLGLTYQRWGVILFVVALIAILALYWRWHSTKALLWSAFAITLSSFILTTRGHERYLFPALAFGAVVAAIGPRLRWVYVLLSATYLVNLDYVYAMYYPSLKLQFLYGSSTPIYLISMLNVALLLYVFGYALPISWRLPRRSRRVNIASPVETAPLQVEDSMPQGEEGRDEGSGEALVGIPR
jgi:Gpi18-like mannosyltransferase